MPEPHLQPRRGTQRAGGGARREGGGPHRLPLPLPSLSSTAAQKGPGVVARTAPLTANSKGDGVSCI